MKIWRKLFNCLKMNCLLCRSIRVPKPITRLSTLSLPQTMLPDPITLGAGLLKIYRVLRELLSVFRDDIQLICTLHRTPDLTGRSTAESSVAHRSPGNSTDDLLLFEQYPMHSPSHSDIHLPLDAAEDVHIDKGKGQDLSDSIPPSPLISQNPLADIPDPQGGKGKERDVAEDLRILSDEAYALMLQTEDLINTLQNMGDAQLSETLDQAWGVEPTMVELVNHTSQIAAVLRQAQAISVAAGNGLSGPSALSHDQQPYVLSIFCNMKHFPDGP
jgi:hypothetical protein